MATITQIAKKAGVSVGTVSGVLNGGQPAVRRDAIKRADRIRQIAAELGYRPNAAARQMRSRRFNAAAVVSRKAIGLFHMDMLKGVCRGLAKHGMHAIHAEIETARAFDPEDAPRFMRELCVDGMIIDECGNIPAELMKALHDLNVPAVYVNTAGEHDCINPDDHESAVRLTRMVLEAGHQKIGYLGDLSPDPRGHYSGRQRLDGARQTVAQAGLAFDEHEAAGINSVDQCYELLCSHRQNTVWICTSDRDAMRFCLAAERAHLRIPEDLSIVTFMNSGLSNDSPVRLTAMLNPMKQMGFAAAEMLIRKINDPTRPLPVEWVKWLGPTDRNPHGQTLGPPPSQTSSVNRESS
jgi:LacI family transcriptional regulator